MKNDEFRSLPLHQKAVWLIRHKSVDLILGALLLFLLGSLFYEEHIRPPVCMNVEMINARADSSGGESFGPFLTEMGCPEENRTVEISKAFQLGNEESDLRIDPGCLLICRVGEGKTDLYFWDTGDLDAMLAKVALMDLREILPPEILLRYEEQLLFTGPVLQGGYPYGIVLEHNRWVRENNFYEDCRVGVARTVSDPELVREFLRYLLE